MTDPTHSNPHWPPAYVAEIRRVIAKCNRDIAATLKRLGLR